ncbi:transcription factor IBH1 isoform X2 [Hevea brasiliensis]|uniref:transcription factor IBH1 isoform X2 n=1 Tax=Hevea brasiliensis TaxID=3981 RepID=UPI000B773591|nr:transcription factor IBH1 isoform X2 [Hevea brasiliensis]
MNPHHHSSYLNPNSLKSRFTKNFLRSLIKINKQTPFPCRPTEMFQRCHKVKTAADKSLACAVGSRRVWSRAMLCKIRNRALRRGPQKPPSVRRIIINNRTMKKGFNCLKEKMNDDQEAGIDQTSKLRKLVPGGEAMDLCNLLDEAAHYIKCLNTQVQLASFLKKLVMN